MGKIRMKCPACGVTLALDEEHLKQYIRCPRCKHKFPAARQAAPATDDLIASWLTEEEPEGPQESPGGASGLVEMPYGADVMGDAGTAAAPTAAPKPMGHGEIRAVKIDRRGVLFEFPASRLLETRFRCAFPRQCMSCDARTHLRPHVVIFTSQLRDSISMEAEHDAGALVDGHNELEGFIGQKLLDRLHEVPNVPYPGNQPMPYWLCDMCSGAGCVSGQIHVSRDASRGWCRLFIRYPRRAMEFMINAGGEGAEGFRELSERVERTAENPWNSLPEVVQQRIQQWYHPKSDEHFLAYVPDRDRTRTEDGMAGVVISNTRLIYHTPRSHHQAKFGQPLELEHASGVGKGRISIITPNWTIHQMTVDRDGITRMRRALTLGRFHAVWR